MNQTGMLPCICWNGSRWWLPVCTSTANAIAQFFVSCSQELGNSMAPHLQVESILRRDPSFLAWAVTNHFQNSPHPSPNLSLTQLAVQTAQNLESDFADGNRCLGAPAVSETLTDKWRLLAAQPLSEDLLAQWLQVTGARVPEAWRSTWPEIHDVLSLCAANAEREYDYGQNTLDLTLLARQSARLRTLTDSFSQTLDDQKRLAMKELAYGLSHEINNPLANISTRAQTLLRDERSPDRIRFLNAIVSQAMRSFELIADMMYFANPPQPNFAKVDVSSLTQSIVQEFQEDWASHGITAAVDLGNGLEATGDREQLADAIRSLLRNSTEAIALSGRIDILLRIRGPHIQLRIADNGKGLSPREQRHAFDPYFSGREAGRGLGLGLCKAMRVAKLHSGDVSLRSGPAGTIATLSFGRSHEDECE